MNSAIGIILISFSSFIAAISQALLKRSAKIKYSKWFEQYLNVRVMLAYLLLFLTIIVNMYALRFITFKLSNIVGTLSYVFVLFISRWFFNEKIGRKKYMGIIIIIIGIAVFNL